MTAKMHVGFAPLILNMLVDVFDARDGGSDTNNANVGHHCIQYSIDWESLSLGNMSCSIVATNLLAIALLAFLYLLDSLLLQLNPTNKMSSSSCTLSSFLLFSSQRHVIQSLILLIGKTSLICLLRISKQPTLSMQKLVTLIKDGRGEDRIECDPCAFLFNGDASTKMILSSSMISVWVFLTGPGHQGSSENYQEDNRVV